MNRRKPYLYSLLIVFLSTQVVFSQYKDKVISPNILLIIADDMGYADIGCYGGDIETPNLDLLALEGVRFSRFHTASTCAPTRAMLLSGNDSHIAGMGSQGLQSSEFGYEGHLTQRIVTVPQVLRSAGYSTYIAGKWHLGMQAYNDPVQKGFDRSFVNLHGAGNHYDDQGLFKDTPVSQYTENGKATTWPKGAYSTDLFTSKIIQYIEADRNKNQPFFAMATYTSPHWPLQVDEQYWKKYKGRYDKGYLDLREKRLKSLIQAGMIPESSTLPPIHSDVIPWDSLSLEEQKKEARKMELYAGMVDNLDYNIGRLFDYLKDIGEYDNTVIVFMSDNGAAADDFYHNSTYGPFIKEHFNEDFDRMGKPDSFISYGPQWAEAGSAPFTYFKGYTSEGGMIAPMIISGPGINRKNEISHGFTTLLDLAPTFYQLAQASYPNRFLGNRTYPLKGETLLPFLNGQTGRIHGDDYVFGFEQNNYAMLRKGDWKITNIQKPFKLENFKLFNISNDLAELNDLSAEEKDIFEDMLNEWSNFSATSRIQVPTPAAE